MIRLLIHTPFFHPTVGGMETLADGLAGELARLGADVHLVAEAPLVDAAELARPYSITRPPYDRAAVVAAADVVLAVGPSTKLLPAARRWGVPFVLSHQAPAGACPIGIGWRDGRSCDYSPAKCVSCRVSGQSTAANVRGIARMHLLRWGMRRAAANVYISEYMAGRTGWCPGVVIPNFYDPTVFYPGETGRPDPAFVFAGRLVSVKGVDIAIRGFALARRRGLEHRLVVVGDGPERSDLERLAAAEGVAGHVDFRGSRRGPDLAEVFRSAYALVFPSQWEEPFGIVMAEAMGSGCPVVASGHGACPEVVGDAGELVGRPADPAAWADALLELAADPARQAALAARAADRAGRLFTLRAVADQYLDILTTATGAPCKRT